MEITGKEKNNFRVFGIKGEELYDEFYRKLTDMGMNLAQQNLHEIIILKGTEKLFQQQIGKIFFKLLKEQENPPAGDKYIRVMKKKYWKKLPVLERELTQQILPERELLAPTRLVEKPYEDDTCD